MAPNNSLSEAERVISYINEKISAGELIVGSKLPTERALAEELEIGRNSAREAMSILSGMGIVERRQGSGSYISKDAKKSVAQIVSMTLSLGRISLRDIFEFRKMTDLTLAHLLIQNGLTSKQEAVFHESLKHLTFLGANLTSDNIDEILYWDDRFHETMMSATENPLLITLDDAITNGYGSVIKAIVKKADLTLISKLAGTREVMYKGFIEKNHGNTSECINYHYKLVEELVK